MTSFEIIVPWNGCKKKLNNQYHNEIKEQKYKTQFNNKRFNNYYDTNIW